MNTIISNRQHLLCNRCKKVLPGTILRVERWWEITSDFETGVNTVLIVKKRSA
jgi:hypothetical protein